MATKSYTKRFRVTKTGKVMRRTQGLSHNRSNKSGNTIRRRRMISQVSPTDRKSLKNKQK